MSTTLLPWTQVAMPHDDVRDEQAVKAEYAVNIGKIDRGDPNVPKHYADPRAFFEGTYVTDDLRRLLIDVMAALDGKKTDRVLQLRTPFGGGKSHSLVAMYHLARSRNDVASLPDLLGVPDPGSVRVAVLPCADLTPGIPHQVKGGPTIHTLWGELAFRLGGGEGYAAVRPIDEGPSAPGGELIETLLRTDKGVGTLLLADEVLIYVVHVLWKRGHGGALIAPGDVPLDDPDVRSEFFKQVGERERWDSVLDADIATDRASAKRIDRRIGEASPAMMQARVGTTTATTVALYSFGARKDELRGVVRYELVASCLRPGVEGPSVDAALGELKDNLLYLHVGGGRYRMDTIPSLTKLVEEAVSNVDPEEVAKRVRARLDDIFGRSTTAIIWPEHAGKIPDERREFLLAYLPLPWAENSPETNEADARTLLLAKTGGEKGGKRQFKNGVAFVVPQKSHADQARLLARRVLALELLRRKAKADHIQVSEEQKDELIEKCDGAVKELDGACRGLYAQVILPVRGKKEGGDPIAFRVIDVGSLASAGGDPHARLFELLKRQVYTEITDERLVEILGLGAPGGPKFLPMAEALDEFFAHLDRPKMRSDAPLLQALAEAVSARRLGYVPSGKMDGEKLLIEPTVRVRFGERHSPDEFTIEDGAFLLAPAYAAELVEARQKAVEKKPDGEKVENKVHVGGITSSGIGEQVGLIDDVVAVKKGEKATRYVVTATAKNKAAWYKLGHAVTQIVGKADKVTITVKVDAHQPAGFDPVYLKNAVEEVLAETDGIDYEAALAKE